MIKQPLSGCISCDLCLQRALQLHASLTKLTSPRKAVSMPHSLYNTLAQTNGTFRIPPPKLQIRNVRFLKDSLQLRDAATFLQDCTQLLQVTGLKTTVCQSREKREINSPASIAFPLLTAANPCSATSSVTTSLLQLPRGS